MIYLDHVNTRARNLEAAGDFHYRVRGWIAALCFAPLFILAAKPYGYGVFDPSQAWNQFWPGPWVEVETEAFGLTTFHWDEDDLVPSPGDVVTIVGYRTWLGDTCKDAAWR